MDKPDLIIPVRFDYKIAAEELKKVEEGGQLLGDATAQGSSSVFDAAKRLAIQIRKLIHPRAGLEAVDQADVESSDRFHRTLDYIKGVSSEFIDLHRTLSRAAGLQRQDDPSPVPRPEVPETTRSESRPEAWRRAQEGFPSEASPHVAGNKARLDPQQFQAYQQRITEFAKARGIATDDAMVMGDGLLRSTEGPQDVDQLLDRYDKVFQALERSPLPVNQLLPQWRRVMSQGFAPEEAAHAVAIMSEAAPGEEAAGVENVVTALGDARRQGKSPELGIEEGMTPIQQIEPAAQTPRRREANGETIDQLMQGCATDPLSRRELIEFVDRGASAGEFEHLRDHALKTGPDHTTPAVRNYGDTIIGHSVPDRVGSAPRTVEPGDQFRGVQQIHLEAKRQLLDRERLVDLDGNPRGDELVSGMAHWPAQAGDLRMRPGIRDHHGENMMTRREENSLGTVAISARIQDLLERIAHSNERMARQGEDRPLAAPPPNPPGRM
jgi:hypothetical protein